MGPSRKMSLEERLNLAFATLEALAKDSNNRLILVLDDMEDLNASPMAQRVFRQVCQWGVQRTLRPVVVSSSLSAAHEFRSAMNSYDLVTITMDTLTQDEASEYLKLKFKAKRVKREHQDKIESYVKKIESDMGLTVSALRSFANTLNSSPMESDVLEQFESSVKKKLLARLKKQILQFTSLKSTYSRTERREAVLFVLQGSQPPTNSSPPDQDLLEEVFEFLYEHNWLNLDSQPLSPAHQATFNGWCQLQQSHEQKLHHKTLGRAGW